MRKSSILYSMIFLLAFGLSAYPVSAQMTHTPSEGAISQPLDSNYSQDFQDGYKSGFNAGFAQGRSGVAGDMTGETRGYTPGDTGEVRGYTSEDTDSSSSAVRDFLGSDTEPATREAPETTGGRWNVPGVDSKVDRSGPGY